MILNGHFGRWSTSSLSFWPIVYLNVEFSQLFKKCWNLLFLGLRTGLTRFVVSSVDFDGVFPRVVCPTWLDGEGWAFWYKPMVEWGTPCCVCRLQRGTYLSAREERRILRDLDSKTLVALRYTDWQVTTAPLPESTPNDSIDRWTCVIFYQWRTARRWPYRVSRTLPPLVALRHRHTDRELSTSDGNPLAGLYVRAWDYHWWLLCAVLFTGDISALNYI